MEGWSTSMSAVLATWVSAFFGSKAPSSGVGKSAVSVVGLSENFGQGGGLPLSSITVCPAIDHATVHTDRPAIGPGATVADGTTCTMWKPLSFNALSRPGSAATVQG